MAKVPVVMMVMMGRNILGGRTWLKNANVNPHPAWRTLRPMFRLLRFCVVWCGVVGVCGVGMN